MSNNFINGKKHFKVSTPNGDMYVKGSDVDSVVNEVMENYEYGASDNILAVEISKKDFIELTTVVSNDELYE